MSLVTYKDLEVWKRSMDIVELIYSLTSKFPSEEKYGLVSQMRRCSVSIPSNIAEGKLRGTQKEFRRFLYHAFASGAELETQLEIAQRLKYLSVEKSLEVIQTLASVMRMLNSLIGKIKV